MSLAKATFSGKVYREPQLRSTTNNVPITYFTFDIGTQEEELIRVRAIGNLAEIIEKNVAKDDKLVVEGNLALSTVKTETGAEKRVVDLNLSSFEKISGAVSVPTQSSSSGSENLVKFTNEAPDELIGEDEIPF